MEAAKQRSQLIGACVVAIVAVVLVGMWTMSSRTQAQVAAWNSKAALTFPNPEAGKASLETLVSLRRASSDRTFILECLADQGAIALDLAGRASPAPDPELTALAKDAFQVMLNRFSDEPLAAGVAHLGLATVAENEFVLDQNPAHKEEARRHLKAITEDAKRFSGTPFMDNALARLNDLDRIFTPVNFAPPAPEPDAGTDESSGTDDPGEASTDDASTDDASAEEDAGDDLIDDASADDPPADGTSPNDAG